MKEKLVWNVYAEIHGKIIRVNVFELSSRFNDYLVDLKKEYKYNPDADYDWFSDKLRGYAISSFWAKFEYEIGLTTFPCYASKKSVKEASKLKTKSDTVMLFPVECEKVDVFMQLDLNWESFANYTFINMNLIGGKNDTKRK